MKGVMGQLKRGEDTSSINPTVLKSALSGAVDRCRARKPVPALNIEDADARIAMNGEQFTMVLTHLIKNAQDATPDDGTVDVTLTHTDGAAVITIADSGAGMSPQFIRDRLFRPFDSTKGVQGMGIGAYQAREFARKLGGDIQVRSEVGYGTTVTMTLPLK